MQKRTEQFQTTCCQASSKATPTTNGSSTAVSSVNQHPLGSGAGTNFSERVESVSPMRAVEDAQAEEEEKVAESETSDIDTKQDAAATDELKGEQKPSSEE